MLSESSKISRLDSVTNFFHKSVVEIKVVLYCKSSAQLLTCLEKVTDIGTGEIAAGGTITFLVNRLIVC